MASLSFCRSFKFGFLLLSCSVVMDSDLFAKLSTDVFERSSLGFRAHKVHEDEVEECRNDENNEELPSDVVECGWTSDKDNDICEVKSCD